MLLGNFRSRKQGFKESNSYGRKLGITVFKSEAKGLRLLYFPNAMARKTYGAALQWVFKISRGMLRAETGVVS